MAQVCVCVCLVQELKLKYLIVCSLCSGLMGLAANVGAEQPAVNTGHKEVSPGTVVSLPSKYQRSVFARVDEAGAVTVSHREQTDAKPADQAVQGK